MPNYSAYPPKLGSYTEKISLSRNTFSERELMRDYIKTERLGCLLEMFDQAFPILLLIITSPWVTIGSIGRPELVEQASNLMSSGCNQDLEGYGERIKRADLIRRA
ncbi:hypothetical protein K9N68_36260 (plasmid) [Kovacikia minuta CCNUW1]|uniref:hypothetical protein n=1 Tax=Kovacikia minuta TaxID=2931930 RepID=UPI001CCD87E5|nr:hypothetical protein [Kovacikia minuta]UBF30626.1 hypothetical protein K9N68_36260 [Kovacikia minuta CCNUW1]